MPVRRKSRNRLRREVALWGGLAVAFLASASVAQAAADSVVEIDDSAQALLDAQVTRRLIGVELRDVDLEAPHSQPRVPRPLLYFRISAQPDGQLILDLWDRGIFYGERHVSAQGNALLRARRLALASAELATVARDRMIRDRRPKKVAQSPASKEKAWMLPASLRLIPAAQAAAIDFKDLFLAGPRISSALVFHQGPRVDLGIGWQAGSAPLPGENSRVFRSEIFIAPAYGWHLGPHELDLGVSMTAATMALHDAPVGPNQRSTRHSWSSELNALVRYHHALSSRFRLVVGLELGRSLHPISLWGGAGDQRIDGFWTGFNVGGEITILGVDRPTRSQRVRQ
ncbi:MAG TPA: hypothetical protein VL137_09795 [Polyangiaceae bacterium]|nr:hypothetical protein [Polyangiaceae bacterium]